MTIEKSTNAHSVSFLRSFRVLEDSIPGGMYFRDLDSTFADNAIDSHSPSFFKTIAIRFRLRSNAFRFFLLILLILSILSLLSIYWHASTALPLNINIITNSLGPNQTHSGWSYDEKENCSVERSSMSVENIAKAKKEWKDFLVSVQPNIDKAAVKAEQSRNLTRGIVYTGHSGVLKQFVLSVKMLRKYKCKLQIEFWHFDEITAKEESMILSLGNVTVINMKNVLDSSLKLKKNDGRMWEMKGASILYSNFDQVLFLDTDNVPVRDPTFLFESQPFKETGAIFWKDFGKLGKNNAIWSILDMKCTSEFEQESGQILIDKSRPDTLKAMYLAAYMQQERKLYFELFWGDKETFRLAWRALKTPYHMIRPHLAVAGIKKNNARNFCGHTMVQFSPMWIPSMYGPPPSGWSEPEKPEIIFMHANLFKYERYQENGKHFPRLLRYRHPEARKQNGGAFSTDSGLCTFLETYIEDNMLTNEVIEMDLATVLPNFEEEYLGLEKEVSAML